MHSPNAEKAAFITPHWLDYYNVVPFGLKNIKATYQRLVTKIFQQLLGETREVYINDMLVKSKECFDHTKHLQEAFELLRRYDITLNPLKCAFRVSLGKFLGFMVTQRGIEANPIQLKAIMDSQTPTSRKGVEQLTGRLAALGVNHISFHKPIKTIFYHFKGSQKSWLE